MSRTPSLPGGAMPPRLRIALDAIRHGRAVVLLDDDDRENEGDLIVAAERITVPMMATLIRECSGIVCLCLPDEHLQQLWLDRRMTVIFVTHSITEAVFLADRVVVLSPKGGWVAADEPIPLPRPRAQGSRTSAEFIGLIQRLSNALNGGAPAV